MIKITFTPNKSAKRRWAFTLMELTIVTVIVGVIGAFSVVGYQRAVVRGYERTMALGIKSIISAQEIYRAKHGTYWDGGQDVPEINQTLGTNLIQDSRVTYYVYNFVIVAGWHAVAYYDDGTTHFLVGAGGQDSTGNVCCITFGGFFPSCPTIKTCSVN